jgi:NAD(P)-dependent dehydrogenase (short-subunit alcohol dehydrogenase family)
VPLSGAADVACLEEVTMGQSVLILGGYGVAGRMLARLLLRESKADVILAGRSLAKAEAASAALKAEYGEERASARAADARDPVSLDSAFVGVDLVAVCSSTLAHVDTVANAALRAGVDYFDLQLSTAKKFAVLEGLRSRIEDEGRCFITDGGIHPGLSAALIRALEPAFDRLERAEAAGLMRVDWRAFDFSTATIEEFVEEFRDYRVEALRDGAWTKVGWRDAQRRIDFGPYFGAHPCSLMYLEELRRLPQRIPSLRSCGFYVAGFNRVVDYALMPLGMAVMKVAPERLGPPYSRLLAWGLRTFQEPPYATVWQVEAEGRAHPDGAGHGGRGPGDAERPLCVRLRLIHEDGYFLTAAAAAACLLQYLDGSIRAPGLHLQALVVEPGRFLEDLRHLGVSVAVDGIDVGALLPSREASPASA